MESQARQTNGEEAPASWLRCLTCCCRTGASGRGTAGHADILAKVIERDRIDSTRDMAPLKAAADAVGINTDILSADEVFEQALALCK